MNRMLAYPCGGWVALCLIALAVPARAQTPREDLARGIDLFNAGQYEQAQQVLLTVERDALDDAGRAERDRYVDEVRLAINLSGKAERDRREAELALDDGKLDRAELLYSAVLRNDYASEGDRRVAEEGLAVIAEKRALQSTLPGAAQPTPSPQTAQPIRTAPAAAPPPPDNPVPTPPQSSGDFNVQPVRGSGRSAAQPGAASPGGSSPSSTSTAGQPRATHAPTYAKASNTIYLDSPAPARTPGGADTQSGSGATTAGFTMQPAQTPATTTAQTEDPDRRAEARILVRRGRVALDEGNVALARDCFESALRLDPTQDEARQGLEEARATGAAADAGASLVDRVRWQKQLMWDRTVSTYNDLETRARAAVQADAFDEANLHVLSARQTIESGRAYAETPDEYASLAARLDTLATFVREREQLWHEEDTARKREEVQTQEALRREQVELARQTRIDELMEQAMQFRRERRLEEAIDALLQIEAIDPTYDRARWMREDIEVAYSLQRQKDQADFLPKVQQKALFDVEEAKVPYPEEIRYPKNWPEITARRAPYNLGSFGGATADRLVYDQLGAVVPHVSLDGLALRDALNEIRNIGGFNMHVNWKALQAAGVDSDAVVNADLRNVRLETALAIVLNDAAAGAPLDYEVDDGVLSISSREQLDQKTVTRVYDIRDLIVHMPNFDDAPRLDLDRPKNPLVNPDQTNESLFNDHHDQQLAQADGQSVIDKLLDTICDTIAPGTWRNRGGMIGSIRELNGQVIVTNTLQAQEQLSSLLDQLREFRAIQVTVEARFLTVRTNFLEDIGMDLDIILNNGNAGFDQAQIATANGLVPATDPNTGGALLIPRQFSRLGFFPSVPGLGTPLTAGTTPAQPYNQAAFVPLPGDVAPHSGQWTPVPILNNVLGFANPSNINTGVPGSFGGANFTQPALQMFGSFLDNIQVDFLLRATQADGRSTFLEAPRLTLSNGQRSWVAVVTQQAYISGLNAVVAEEVGQVEPIVSTLNTGSVLDCEVTVGADRRYVTMTVRAGRALLEDLRDIEVQTTGTSSRGVGALIQVPRIQVSQARGTITVPDGGTVLLGGLKLTGESELEGGVPILSKIPVLKRAYSSRTMVKDESMLLILIKPTITITEEAEELAFPSFAG